MTPNKLPGERLPIIGVTGNSGAGKGAVCEILRGMGGFCVDADKLAHKVMEPGEPAYNEIADEFGGGIISPDGSIDRKKLGGIVFRDPARRKVLEGIIHSKVIRLCRRLTIQAQNAGGYSFAVWDAPLLAEAGMHAQCDTVLLVTAPFPVKLSRIQSRDGISEEQAILRLSNQTPDSALYRKLTEDMGETRVKVITNNGNLQDLAIRIQLSVTDTIASNFSSS